MAKYIPENSIEIEGSVDVIEVFADLTISGDPQNAPRTVSFDATESIGEMTTLEVIGQFSVEFTGDRSTWVYEYIFIDEGVYDAILTVYGGISADSITTTVEVLPGLPEDDEIPIKTIIRVLRIEGFASTEEKLNADGETI